MQHAHQRVLRTANTKATDEHLIQGADRFGIEWNHTSISGKVRTHLRLTSRSRQSPCNTRTDIEMDVTIELDHELQRPDPSTDSMVCSKICPSFTSMTFCQSYLPNLAGGWKGRRSGVAATAMTSNNNNNETTTACHGVQCSLNVAHTLPAVLHSNIKHR
eukprot:TRINITY_DN235_c3_g2_i1.p1 TRINITY_DN235_c3_g2~~TRINITY_DN235_c3_g2_i1.p1  ORF type:complete len:160 (+),score=14.37 TRINITY_DN235_c3_g2_i1:200-679(+)